MTAGASIWRGAESRCWFWRRSPVPSWTSRATRASRPSGRRTARSHPTRETRRRSSSRDEKCRSLGGNFTGTSMYSGHCVFPCSNLTVFKAGMTWNISPLSWQDCHPQCEDYGAYLKDDLSWCHASTECIPRTDDFKVPKDPGRAVTGLTGTSGGAGELDPSAAEARLRRRTRAHGHRAQAPPPGSKRGGPGDGRVRGRRLQAAAPRARPARIPTRASVAENRAAPVPALGSSSRAQASRPRACADDEQVQSAELRRSPGHIGARRRESARSTGVGDAPRACGQKSPRARAARPAASAPAARRARARDGVRDGSGRSARSAPPRRRRRLGRGLGRRGRRGRPTDFSDDATTTTRAAAAARLPSRRTAAAASAASAALPLRWFEPLPPGDAALDCARPRARRREALRRRRRRLDGGRAREREFGDDAEVVRSPPRAADASRRGLAAALRGVPARPRVSLGRPPRARALQREARAAHRRAAAPQQIPSYVAKVRRRSARLSDARNGERPPLAWCRARIATPSSARPRAAVARAEQPR